MLTKMTSTTKVGRLTVRTLGGDALRQFSRIANPDLVLGTDSQHILVTGNQPDDTELTDIVGRCPDWNVRRLCRVSLLDDVPRDGFTAVRLWSGPAERDTGVCHFGHRQAAWHAWSSWKQHQQQSHSNKLPNSSLFNNSPTVPHGNWTFQTMDFSNHGLFVLSLDFCTVHSGSVLPYG